MEKTRTRICPLCEQPRTRFVTLEDRTEICSECFKVARLDPLYQKETVYSNPLDKDVKLFEPQQCSKCDRWVTQRSRWVEDARLCRKCHRGLQFGLDPPGAYFIDERGRIMVAQLDPKKPKFAYGIGFLPRSRVTPLASKVGRLAFKKQVALCWEAVVEWRPFALKVARRYPNSEELVSDVGYSTIGRCRLLNEDDNTFKAFLDSSLRRAYRRAHKKQLSHLSLLEFDEPQPDSQHAADAIDELRSFQLDEDDLYLLEQRLLYGKPFSALGDEYGLTAAGVRRRFRVLLSHIRPPQSDA